MPARRPVPVPSVAWIDSLVERRRRSGLYSEEELEDYRRILIARYWHALSRTGTGWSRR